MSAIHLMAMIFEKIEKSLKALGSSEKSRALKTLQMQV